MSKNKELQILLVGTDPEVFMERNGKVINIVPYISTATKHDPLPMDKEGFFFMYDRASVEFNVPPTNNLKEFKDNLSYAMNYIKGVLPNNLEFSKEVSVFLSDEEIALAEECQTAGCSPSWSPYGGIHENEAPDIKKYPNLHAVGFHYHLELNHMDEEDFCNVIKALDLFLGVPSVLLDTDINRRSIYGQAGASRFDFNKNRLEYRVLSSFLLHDEKLIDWGWNNLYRAIDWLNEGNDITKYEAEILEAINKGNLVLADKLVRELNLLDTSLIKKEQLQLS